MSFFRALTNREQWLTSPACYPGHTAWWFLSCVSLLGPAGAMIKHSFSVCLRVFPDEMSIWISGLLKADYPAQYWLASSNTLRTWGARKEEFAFFASYLPVELEHLSSSILRMRLTSWVPLVLRPSDADQMCTTSLQMADHGTSQPP